MSVSSDVEGIETSACLLIRTDAAGDTEVIYRHEEVTDYQDIGIDISVAFVVKSVEESAEEFSRTGAATNEWDMV